MSDEDEVRHLSAEEIGLLKEVARWRRNHDVTFYLTRRGQGLGGAHGFLQWDRFSDAIDGWSGRVRSTVTIERESPGDIGEARNYRYGTFSYHRVTSVREGVDLLVAYGYLPPRFSSAYRAGWEASLLWHDPEVEPRSEAFAKAFHDPKNISFPAVEPTW